ncbi:MAG: hypothetical protein L3J08_00725 [Flavobacteriaceae bacterium]|nr:hypothetical protein [Flavobacteriaceae bacterium]
MSKDLENIFKKSQNEFDFEEPNIGHFERFEARLKSYTKSKKSIKGVKWYWLSAAASILLIFGFWLGNNKIQNNIELTDISPKMEETQNFYISAIQKEIEQIQKGRTPQNKKIIDDAFKQLDILEKNHQKLSIELKESNEDKRVIYAIITNFQMQIEVLQNLVEQLEEFKVFQKVSLEENEII